MDTNEPRSAEVVSNGGIRRREFLRHTAVGALPVTYALGGGALPLARDAGGAARAPRRQPGPGLIIREREPQNLEFPFATLNGPLTPTEQFYVRNHFALPQVEAGSWRLRIEGVGNRAVELSYEDVVKLPARTITATLECAGNSRVFLVPTVAGAQWELGGVSTATWTGVSLSTVLDHVGVHTTVGEVVLEGADNGPIRAEYPPIAGSIHFARSLPMAKALQPEVLLAYRMNGAPLPAAHGFPLRAVVPGWYGVASVKWLTRLIVTDRPFQGYFQTLEYSYWERRDGLPSLRPITELQVKAEIARPAILEVVPAGTVYQVQGAAWTGESVVTKVEISQDNGLSWATARLMGAPLQTAWRLWAYAWHTPARAGRYTLLARATDARGRVQPMQRDTDRRSYMINHVLPIAVEVR